jgi:hypothetical protein
MNEDPKMERLNRAVRQWSDQSNGSNPPAALEQSLFAEFARVHAARRRRRWVSALGIAAATIVALWIGFKPVGQPLIAHVEAPSAPSAVGEEPFVPIPYVISPAPFERVEVVRMEMPVAALIAAGIPVVSLDPSARVQADVVVGQDGRAHAVRIVSTPQSGPF